MLADFQIPDFLVLTKTGNELVRTNKHFLISTVLSRFKSFFESELCVYVYLLHYY